MSLTALSTELLTIVVGFLISAPDRNRQTVRQDLHSLTLSCRRLNDIATPLLYRSISIPNGSAATYLFHTLIHHQRLRPLIRELSINRGTRRTRLSRFNTKIILDEDPAPPRDDEKIAGNGDEKNQNGFFEGNFERACRKTFKTLKWDVEEFSSADRRVFALGECQGLANGSLSYKDLDEVGFMKLTSSIVVGILCLTQELDDVQLPVLIDKPYEIMAAMVEKARARGCLRLKIMPQLSSFGTVSDWVSLI